MSKNKFILVIDTLCQGTQPAWWTDDKPVLHDTLREANLELAEEIEDQIERFRDDEDAEELDIHETHIVECVVQDDGTVLDKFGTVLFDPAVGRP